MMCVSTTAERKHAYFSCDMRIPVFRVSDGQVLHKPGFAATEES